MADVKIRLRDHGPLVVEGPFTCVDAEGRPFKLPENKPVVALCRCGASKNRPFCDGSHKAAGFEGAERAPADPTTGGESAPNS